GKHILDRAVSRNQLGSHILCGRRGEKLYPWLISQRKAHDRYNAFSQSLSANRHHGSDWLDRERLRELCACPFWSRFHFIGSFLCVQRAAASLPRRLARGPARIGGFKTSRHRRRAGNPSRISDEGKG